MQLRDPSLELDLKRVHGEMETVRRQLEAARATKTSRDIRDENPVELYRLSASESEFNSSSLNLESELKLLHHERDNLVVRSPIAGRILTWDLANRLAARPVERGEALVTVADLVGRLAVGARRRRRPHRPRPRGASDGKDRGPPRPLPPPLRRRVVHRPHRKDRHDGHPSTRKTKPPPSPTIEVVVAFDKNELTEAARRDLRPGVTARAEIDCGRRSLGYVWLHDIWDAAITWLRF